MSVPKSCPKCGAGLDGVICRNCNAYMGLVSYGFETKRTPSGGYLLLDQAGNPIHTFGSLGPRTAKTLVEKTQVPREVIDRELANLANVTTHVEETEDETGVLVKYVPSKTTSEFIAEQIWDGKTAPMYALKRFDDNKIEYVSEITLGESDDKEREIIYRPVYNDHLLTGMVTIPQKPVETGFEEMIQEAFAYLGQTEFFDPCGKIEQVKLGGMVTMGSWFIDRMIPKTSIPVAGFGRFAPIISIRGVAESGKNRLANLYRFLSYRPIFVESTHRIPSLFRPLDLWKGTLVMDEADFYKTGPQANIIQFLNCRATGTPIPRQNPDKVSECQVFESFGITILTQRQHFDDNATESRAIPYYTERTSHKIPTIELDEVVEWGLRLQNKLLFLRLMYWNQFEIDKRYWVSGISDHRLNAALLPTVSLSKFEPKISDIIEICVVPIERAKRRIKANSVDGRIVNLLWEKISEGYHTIHNLNYCVLDSFDITTDDEGAEIDKIPIALIASKIKERIGLEHKVIRKSLNSLNMTPDDAPVKARIGKRSDRVVWFIPEKLEKHLREFVLDYEENQIYEKLGLDVPHVPDVPLPTPPWPSGDIKNINLETPMGGNNVEQAEQVEQKGLVTEARTRAVNEKLIKAIRAEGRGVGEFWPRAYLEQNGHTRLKAEAIVIELFERGQLSFDYDKKEWSVP